MRLAYYQTPETSPHLTMNFNSINSFRSFLENKNMTFPESLKSHFSQEAQSSLYLKAPVFRDCLKISFVQENLKRFLPMLDYLTHVLGVFTSIPETE